jgi:iron(III) transport system ATP-binding protein
MDMTDTRFIASPVPTNAPAALEIIGVRKDFESFSALRDVHLRVNPGEMLCFLGPSGCGKTTLLRIIAGLETQTAGQILQNGKDVSWLSPDKRDYGIVFQSYALFPNLTIAENIGYGLVNSRARRGEIKARVEELLKLVGLPTSGNKYPSQLSGGQQQRVALARALATAPASCCSTSRCRRSTRWSASACAARSAGCKSRSASPPSWSRTTRKRRCRWPTASWS